jgi:cytochrome P450
MTAKVKELYMTKLLNSQRMQQFKPMRAREAEGLVRSVWEGRGGAQDVRAKLQERACDLMSRMVVGRSFGELESITRTSGPVILGTFYEALDAVGTPDVAEFLPGPLHRLHLQPLRVRRTRSTFRRLDSIFQRIIDHRRERDSPASDHRGHHDLLDTLLAQHVDATHLLPGQPRFTDDNIKAIFWVRFSLIDGMELGNWASKKTIRNEDEIE